jgi:hypothetical protein
MGRRLGAGDTSVRLPPGAMTEAEGFSADHPETHERYKREVVVASSRLRRGQLKPPLPAPSTDRQRSTTPRFWPTSWPTGRKSPRAAVPGPRRKPLICRELQEWS